MKRSIAMYCFTALLLSACTPPVQQIGNTTVLTTTGADGKVVTTVGGEGTPYPADFPVARYPGSKVLMTQNGTLSGTGSGTGMMMLTTVDSYDKTAGFYRDFFNSNGFKIVSEANVAGIVNITAEKNNETISVSACPSSGNADGAQTSITISRVPHN